MRVPDPEKWKATSEELEMAWEEDFNPYHEGFNSSGHVAALTETVARRRALDELRALLPSCNAAQIHARIHEIEAEGE